MKNYVITLIFVFFAPFLYAEESEFLPVEQAFPFTWQLNEQGAALVKFDTQQGYYLYKSRFSFKGDESLSISEPSYSLAGEEKQDQYMGNVVVFHNPLEITLPYTGEGTLTVRYQGCADKGLCYLPQKQTIQLPLSSAGITESQSDGEFENGGNLESDGNFESDGEFENEGNLENDSYFDLAILSTDTSTLSSFLSSAGKPEALLVFFLLGLGLSLTPCVLPMIPILASIIGGQEAMTGRKGAALSSAYVLGMASSYAITGILVTTLAKGVNLQAAMQQPWLLTVFAALFVLLALAMFGFYELQLPAALQQRLNQGSDKLGGGKMASVFAMGAISALVVSPCVSAPLAGTLLYVSTTQDWLFGGATLFVMALGMGVPLIAIGASGGRLLLRSGAWMVSVKQIFGVLLLAVSIVLLSRFIDATYIMALWALLAIGTGIHFGALESANPGWPRTRKLVALLPLFYGLIMFVGLVNGGTDPFDPLQKNSGVSRSVSNASQASNFIKLSSIDELETTINDATSKGDKVLIDLYADWCVSCKVIEKNVFADAQISQQLNEWKKIKLDVTDSTPEQMAWLNDKNVYGPPAIFFYSSVGEMGSARIMGDIDKKGFSVKLAQANADAYNKDK